MVALSGLGEAGDSNLDSYNRLTHNPATNLNCASQALHSRQRTDTLPSRFRKKRIATSGSDVPRLPKLQCCSICLESMDSSLWTCPSYLCAHEPRTCESCLEAYVIYSISDGLTEILCPDVGCRKEIGYEDILTHVHENEEYLNRYNNLLAQRELERRPNFVWCTNPWCGQGQIHDGGATVPLVTCDSCHERTCFVHRIPWHNNLTCDQYSKHEENEASEEYIRIYMKRCPNTECKRPVEKIAGSDHMTCHRPGGCGHQFCWVCLADYSSILQEGNHKHNPDCRYFVQLAPNNGAPGATHSMMLTMHCGTRLRGPRGFTSTDDRENEYESTRQQRVHGVAISANTLIPPGYNIPPSPPLSPPPLPRAQTVYSSEPDIVPCSVSICTSAPCRHRPGGTLGAEASGSRSRPEMPSLPRRARAYLYSPTTSHTLRLSRQEPAPALRASVRTRVGCYYVAPAGTQGPPRRIGTPGPSSTHQTPSVPWRSEIYHPPPLPQYIPQIRQSEYPEPPTPPRRSTQSGPIASPAVPTLEEIRERLLHMMKRRLPNPGEGRQPSSIPDFESEVVLYRVHGR